VSTSPVFEWLATELEQHTGLDALKSRGTLRLALHGAGLEPRTLTKEQAAVVIAKILPGELKLRGFVSGPNICMHLAAALRLMAFSSSGPEAAETAFARLGRK
jgi:hypothetical protein